MRAIYDRLSFQVYDLYRPRLDTEWLLSTLFDASLLSTLKAAAFGGFFLPVGQLCQFRTPLRDGADGTPPVVNLKLPCHWTPGERRAMICSS
jgi:hypothetical protein